MWNSCPNFISIFRVKERKDILVTGRTGPYEREALRLPHFLENCHIEGGEVVSLTRRPGFAPRKVLVLISVRG
jgi:hypothetical protein